MNGSGFLIGHKGPGGRLSSVPRGLTRNVNVVKEGSETKRSEISLKLSEMFARQWVPIVVRLNSYCIPTTFLALAGTKPSETRAKFTKSFTV